MNKVFKNITAIVSATALALSLSIPTIFAENKSLGANVFYAQAGEVSPQGKMAQINFSQTPEKELELSDIKMYRCNEGTEVALTKIDSESNTLTVGFDEELKALSEYVIKLPNNLKSSNGNVINDSNIYFVTTENEPYDKTVTNMEQKFSDEMGFYNKYASDGSIVPLSLVDSGEEEHGQVWQIENTGSGVNNAGGTRYYAFYPVFHTDADAHTIECSFDFKVPEATYYGAVVFQNTQATRSMLAIRSDGYVSPCTGAGYHTDSTSFNANSMRKYKIDEWNNFKIVVSLDTKTVYYYFNGEACGLGNYTGDWGTEMTVRVDSETVSTDKSTVMWFDNFKVNSIKTVQDITSCRVKSVQFINRDTSIAGPLSEGKVFGNAQGAKITFSDWINASTLSSAVSLGDGENDIQLSFGDFNEADNSVMVYFDEVLERNRNYTLSINGVENSSMGLVDAYTTRFKTSDVGFLMVDNIGITDGSNRVLAIDSTLVGKTLEPNLKITNATDNDAQMLVSFISYNASEMKQLVSGEYKVEAGDDLEVNGEDLRLSIDNVNDLTLKVIVLEKTEQGYKVCAQKMLTNMSEISEISRTFKYDGVANSANNDIVFEMRLSDNTTVIHKDSVQSNGEAIYNITFNVAEKYRSGKYNLVVYENNFKAVTYPVVYVNKDEMTSTISAINGFAPQGNVTSVANEIKNHAYALNIDDSIVVGLNYLDTAKSVNEYISKNGLLDGVDTENALKVINKAAYQNAASGGLIKNIFTYADSLSFDESSIKGWYKKYYVDKVVQEYVTSKLKGTDATSFEKFDKELLEAFILAVVLKPDGTDNLRELFGAFSNEIGIDATAPDSVYRAIAGNNYNDYTSLKNAFNAAKNETINVTNRPSGGGGGAGSIMSSTSDKVSNVGTVVSTTQVQNEATPLLINIFKDIDDSFWGKTAIVSLAQQGILNGRADGCFYPNDNITREEFVKIIIETFEYDTVNMTSEFTDVAVDSWYAPYISAAAQAGIISGYEDNTFGVGENISRQDMCVILYRAAKDKGYEFMRTEGTVFADNNSISEYAQECISILNAEEIVNGYSTGEFKPFSNSTRAECATVVYNFMALFNKI